MSDVRRGVILPVVLVVLLVLGVVAAAFSFRVHADLSSTQVVTFRLQTRLAAQAGIEKIRLMLRTDRLDMSTWYDNPEELNRIVLWASEGDETTWGSNEEFTHDLSAYRFSLVADDPTDDEDFCRYGITDESSKLHLNLATEEQLLLLVGAAVGDDEEIIPQDIVDAILDWRDADDQARGEAGDTEGKYYESLGHKPYKVKNGPFDTVEELLLVKGVTRRILYGEDRDRNGLLTANEDDGDDSFPPDNEDNSLNRGLYPYLTVCAGEEDISNDNRPRAYMFGDEAALRSALEEDFEDEPEIIDFIVSATRGQQPSAGGSGESGDASGADGVLMGPGGGGRDRRPGGEAEGGRRGGPGADGARREGPRPGSDPGDDPSAGSSERRGGGKSDSRKRRRIDEPGDKDPPDAFDNEEDPPTPDEKGEVGGDEEPEETGGLEDEDEEFGEEGEGEEGEGEEGDGQGGSSGMTSPAALLKVSGANPLALEHLPILMDRLTVHQPQERYLPGLININTASYLVLKCLGGLTGEQISAIIETRGQLEPEVKVTTAWLVTEEVLDLDTYVEIAPLITARGRQFMIESLGYADHIGMVTRLQVIVEMVGPVTQIIYYRDLSHLGGHFPIREEDGEKIRVQR